MYDGLSYKLSLRFPVDYPFKPPQVKFETTCFHPNVDQFGNICLDILQVTFLFAYCISVKNYRFICFIPNFLTLLQDKWSSAYDCRTILLSIQSLLGGHNGVAFSILCWFFCGCIVLSYALIVMYRTEYREPSQCYCCFTLEEPGRFVAICIPFLNSTLLCLVLRDAVYTIFVCRVQKNSSQTLHGY